MALPVPDPASYEAQLMAKVSWKNGRVRLREVFVRAFLNPLDLEE